MDGNGEPMMNAVQVDVELDRTVEPETEYAATAILCSDQAPPGELEAGSSQLDRILDDIVHVSQLAPHFGGLSIPFCYNWKAKVLSSERFTGPFNHTLANTILIVGNTVSFFFWTSFIHETYVCSGGCKFQKIY